MSNNPNWMKLDNAAKIFPANSNKRDTKVFRIACALKEEVNKNKLQQATNETLKDFPLYKNVLKRGLFWYYLEESDIPPKVSLENMEICAPIYHLGEKNLLFRISYYKCRINFEVYHVLTDGAGAFEFFKVLIVNYLKLKYPNELKNKKLELKYDATHFEKIDDSFKKYYDNKGIKKKVKIKQAYQFKGKKYSERRMNVIEGILSTKAVIDLAHKYDATVTVLIVAIFMKSISEEMTLKDKNREVVVTIPVNFRQFFKSLSGRNFFGIFNVNYDFKNDNELESIIKYLNKIFKDNLNFEEMSSIINRFVSIENNILVRPVPLIIKDFVLNFATKIEEKNATAVLSNVGRFVMPKEVSNYISMVSVYISTNNPQICVCSYEDVMSISFTSPFINTNIQRNFFKTFTTLGLKVKIQSNYLEDGGENE